MGDKRKVPPVETMFRNIIGCIFLIKAVLDSSSSSMIGDTCNGEEKVISSMQQTRINTAILITLIGFFLGMMAISFHHHDKALLLPGCSICKAKTSLTGTLNKIKDHCAPAALVLFIPLTAILPGLTGVAPTQTNAFIHLQVVETYPNKAPPCHF